MEVAAALAYANGTFRFNREGWWFDKKLSQKCAYQSQEMKIRQFELYREDIRDLVDLTVGKMDNYLVVNTLQLGFSITLFVEGRHEPDTKTPAWLTMLFILSNACALLFYAQSVWLAMHASISAHATGVQTLTQFVRLPVPTDGEIDAARAVAKEFEGEKLVEMFRFPILRQQMQKLQEALKEEDGAEAAVASGRRSSAAAALSTQSSAPLQSSSGPATQSSSAAAAGTSAGSSSSTTASASASASAVPAAAEAAAAASAAAASAAAAVAPRVDVRELEHIKMFRERQRSWQSYDAYARVCMTIGALMTLHALSYYSLGRLAEDRGKAAFETVRWPAVSSVVLFTTASWALVYLDLYLSRVYLIITCCLAACPPGITVVAMVASALKWQLRSRIVYMVFVLHTLLILLTLQLAWGRMVRGVALPTHFRSILYLDVLASKRRTDPGEQSLNNAPPGNIFAVLPWYNFRVGCVLCALIWSFGTAWCIAEDTPYRDSDGRPHPSREVMLTAPAELALSGPWPHPFFRATQLACHSGLGKVALVAEKYSVHALPLVDGAAEIAQEIDASLALCLPQIPGFLGRGLDSISVDCEWFGHEQLESSWNPAAPRCSLLVSVVGSAQVAWCPLQQGDSHIASSPRFAEMLGSPWHSVVTAGGGQNFSAWAIGLGSEHEEHSARLVRLRRVGTGSLVPEMAIELPEAFMPQGQQQQRSVSVIPGHAVVALQPDGVLHGWPYAAADSWHMQLSFSDPDGDEVKWGRDGWRAVSSCWHDGSMLILGRFASRASRTSDTRIWRFPMPVALSSTSLTTEQTHRVVEM